MRLSHAWNTNVSVCDTFPFVTVMGRTPDTASHTQAESVGGESKRTSAVKMLSLTDPSPLAPA
jgi:hypothetical protein